MLVATCCRYSYVDASHPRNITICVCPYIALFFSALNLYRGLRR
jgi:hypothetical protein